MKRKKISALEGGHLAGPGAGGQMPGRTGEKRTAQTRDGVGREGKGTRLIWQVVQGQGSRGALDLAGSGVWLGPEPHRGHSLASFRSGKGIIRLRTAVGQKLLHAHRTLSFPMCSTQPDSVSKTLLWPGGDAGPNSPQSNTAENDTGHF